MTKEQKTEAPEHLWVDTFSKDSKAPNWPTKPVWAATQYTRTDLSQAAMGAAVKRCAEVAEKLADKWHTEYKTGNGPHRADTHREGMSDGAHDIAEEILATAPEAVKAFEEHEARHKAELEAVLRKAVAVIDDPDFTQEDVDYVDNAHKWVLLEEAQTAILALIDQPSALDELLAEAERKGMERAAEIIKEQPLYKHPDTMAQEIIAALDGVGDP